MCCLVKSPTRRHLPTGPLAERLQALAHSQGEGRRFHPLLAVMLNAYAAEPTCDPTRRSAGGKGAPQAVLGRLDDHTTTAFRGIHPGGRATDWILPGRGRDSHSGRAG